MERNHNFYYAQYAYELESNPGYDSNGGKTCVLFQSEWELDYQDNENAIDQAIPHDKLEEDIKVRLGKNYVKFVYKYRGNDVLGVESFRFKITLVYHKTSRKWYISPGYSFVPEVIRLEDKLKFGTFDPVSDEVLRVVHDAKRSINVFMTSLTIVHEFVRDVQRSYKDMQFHVDPTLKKMQLTFSENAWPHGLQKLNFRDTITVELTLNRNLHVCNITYEYAYIPTSKFLQRKKNINRLKLKLYNFYDFPLQEALEKFMEEENYTTQENSMQI